MDEKSAPQGADARVAVETLLRHLKAVDAERIGWQYERADLLERNAQLEKEKAALEKQRADDKRKLQVLQYTVKAERQRYLSNQAAAAGSPHGAAAAAAAAAAGGVPAKRVLRPSGDEALKAGASSAGFSEWKARKNKHVTMPGRIPKEVMADLSAYLQQDDREPTLLPAAAKKKSAATSAADAVSPAATAAIAVSSASPAAMPDHNNPTAPGASETPTGTASASALTSPASSPDSSVTDGFLSPAAAVAAAAAAASPAGSGSELEFVRRLVQQSMESKMPQGKMWKPKVTLKNHMDGVRAVAFDPDSLAIMSGSEDGTAKWWSIDAHLSSKKKPLPAPEPVYTFFGHRGMVTSVAVKPKARVCFTGGVDGNAIMWTTPSATSDTYDAFGNAGLHRRAVYRHGGAIWDVVAHPAESSELLFTACADGNVYTWQQNETTSYVRTVACPAAVTGGPVIAPTSICVQATDASRLLVGWTNGQIASYDIETGRVIATFNDRTDSPVDAPNRRVTKLVTHPVFSLCISAHVDRVIRWFDIDRAESVHLIKAHRDVVSSVALDSEGLNLVSGGHDQAIRFWEMTTQKIMQDLDPHQSHKTKYDEAVHCVAYHPRGEAVASGGADSLIKIYT